MVWKRNVMKNDEELEVINLIMKFYNWKIAD